MKIKNYIWDFDGTLFDTYQFISLSFQKALEDFNINENQIEVFNQLKISVESATDYCSNKYNIDRMLISQSYKKYSHAYDYNLIMPFKKSLQVLKQIIKLGGKNYIYTHRGSSTFEILKHYKAENCFLEIVDSTYNFLRKPAPDALLYLIKKYNMEPKETIYIGDRDIDIECAKNAKIISCFYSEKECAFADYNVKSFEDLLKLL